MGTILRCLSCDRALIRVTHVKGRYWLDMRGVSVLQIDAKLKGRRRSRQDQL
jgi:hypothetical protein